MFRMKEREDLKMLDLFFQVRQHRYIPLDIPASHLKILRTLAQGENKIASDDYHLG